MNNQWVLVLLGAALLSADVHAGKKYKLYLDAVPEHIRTSAQKLMPDVKFKTANTETESDGTMVYELQGMLPDGRKVEVDIFGEGETEEIEVEFNYSLVPDAVLQAIEAEFPGFKPFFIEASYSKSKQLVQYEFRGQAAGKDIDLEVPADGRKVIVADR